MSRPLFNGIPVVLPPPSTEAFELNLENSQQRPVPGVYYTVRAGLLLPVLLPAHFLYMKLVATGKMKANECTSGSALIKTLLSRDFVMRPRDY